MTKGRSVQLEITDEAAHAIVGQALYYRDNSSNGDLGAMWERAVTETVRSLLVMPERGAPCFFRSTKLRGLRWVPVEGFPSHKVFYRFQAKAQTVLVVDVLHGARDLDALFSERK